EYTGPEEDVRWQLSGAPAELMIMEDGGLIIPGTVGCGLSFAVQAVSADGTLLAEKTVTLPNKLYDWADEPTRGYLDFETQIVGTVPEDRMLGQANWNDYMFSFEGKDTGTGAGSAIVKSEIDDRGNENKYVSASGAMDWSNRGTTLQVITTGKLSKGRAVAFEGRFMAESAALGSETWTLFLNYDVTNRKVINDFRYKAENGRIGIYCYMFNGSSLATPRKLTEMEPDTWFWVREDFDAVNHTLSLYINEDKVIDREPRSHQVLQGFKIGAAVDDIAVYTGAGLVPTLPETLPEVLYFAEGMSEAVINLDEAVRLGSYAMDGTVRYECSGGTVADGKLFVPAGDGDITVSAESSTYGLSESFTLRRTADGVAVPAVGAGEQLALGGMQGQLLMTFQTAEALDITLQTEEEQVQITAAVPAAAADAVIVVNTLTGQYKAIFDGQPAQEGALPGGLVRLMNQGGELRDFVCASMTPTAPFAFSPVIDGITAVGQELTANYTYYSPWDDPQTGAQIIWYVAAAPAGDYRQAGTGAAWTPAESLANQYVKVSVAASDSRQTGSPSVSEPAFIRDVYSVTLRDGTLRVEVQNALGGDNVYAAARLYAGGVLQKTMLEKIEFNGADSQVWQTHNLTGIEGAAVTLLYASDLKPVGVCKTAGTVPAETVVGVSGQTGIYAADGKLYVTGGADSLVSLLIYGHEDEETSITDVYSRVFTRDEVLAAAGTAAAGEKLAYATALLLDGNGRAVLQLPALSRGSYRVDLIPRNGEPVSALFMREPEAVLVPAVMDLTGFADVLSLYYDDVDAAAEMYGLYSRLSTGGKAYAARILSGGGYDVCQF
ncbi:MAG: hypothetical protein ACI4QW_03970, partial [Clostridia bacterium]